ncbi:MAG TPA: hypothetical protein VG755_44990 [Nannocystaceae bacterium]|nr:hypothetical protein [Nannocystaceae bacterium]
MSEIDDELAGEEPTEPLDPRSGRRRPAGVPWARVLLGAAVAMPALAFGGVHAATVVAFVAIVSILWLRLCTRARAAFQIPLWSAIGLLAVGVTLVQWLPLPGLRPAFAHGLDAMIFQALDGTNVVPRAGLSPVPDDTGLEVARLFGLLVLFASAAQLSWRVSAAVVTGLGTAVALIGFAHEAAGFQAIYGVYAARDVDLAGVSALLGTFVNANHQSGLLLLGIFSGIALAADQHAHGLVTADPGRVDRYGDRFLAAMAGVTIQIPALVLSLSRGALLAFIVVGPVAAWLAMRRQSSGRRARRRRAERLSPARLMVLGGAVCLFLLVAQHGAWRELATLSSFGDSMAETDHKLSHARQAFELLALDPLFGIGRGAFVDLFPAVREPASHVLATHLECAPAAMLIEWGPWFGGAILLGLTAWWLAAMIHGGTKSDRNARRIVLLGLLAVAMQNSVDFAFEFLGVAAPAIALAGGLSPGPRFGLRPRRGGVMIGLGLAAALAIAFVVRDGTQLRREAVNADVVAGKIDAAIALRARPLDGRLHGLLARKHAQAVEWEQALARADAATRLRPGNVDPWLLRGTALRELGQLEAGDDAVAHALQLVHERPNEALLAWLLWSYPDPAALARLTPDDPEAWTLLLEALAPVAPLHADAVAAARGQAHPDDPEVLRWRHALAVRAGNAPLALHHARLWRQLAPRDVNSNLAVARAYRAFVPARLAEARDALELALADGRFADLAERGLLEQELVAALLDIGDEASVGRARKLMPELMTRPASREVRRAIDELAGRLERL